MSAEKLLLTGADWVNHVCTPTPNLTVATRQEITIPCDWTVCPLEAGTPVSLWVKATIENPIEGRHYRFQWSAHQYAGTQDVTAARLAAGLRVDWLAQYSLDAPRLTTATLNDAPPMTITECALMRSANMTAAFAVQPFAAWYGLT